MSLQEKTGSCVKHHCAAQGSTTTKAVCLFCLHWSSDQWQGALQLCMVVFVNLAQNGEMLYLPCEQPHWNQVVL